MALNPQGEAEGQEGYNKGAENATGTLAAPIPLSIVDKKEGS